MDAPDPLIGLTIAGWRLRRRLGAGGMGAVYAAAHRTLGQGAFKVLLVAGRDEADLVDAARRLRDEATAASTLACPWLARVLDAGETPDAGPFLVYEYLPGDTLRKRLADVGRLAPDDVHGDVAGPLLAALGALHGAGIVHRDVKPENLIAGADGRFRLADLGLAFFEGREARTRTGAVFGTPGYVAPERLLQSTARPSPAGDCYAAAVVVVECLTGRLPWRSREPGAVVREQLDRDVAAADLRALGVPPGAAEPLAAALARAPEARGQDALALAAALSSTLRGALPAAPSRTVHLPQPAGAAKACPAAASAPRPRRPGLRYALAALTAVAAVAGTAWLVRPNHAPTPPAPATASAAPRGAVRRLLDAATSLASTGPLPDPARLRTFDRDLDEFASDEASGDARRLQRLELLASLTALPPAPAAALARAALETRAGRTSEAEALLADAVANVRRALARAAPACQERYLDVERVLSVRLAALRARLLGWTPGQWAPFDACLASSDEFAATSLALEVVDGPACLAHRTLLRLGRAELVRSLPDWPSLDAMADALVQLVRSPQQPPWARTEAVASLGRLSRAARAAPGGPYEGLLALAAFVEAGAPAASSAATAATSAMDQADAADAASTKVLVSLTKNLLGLASLGSNRPPVVAAARDRCRAYWCADAATVLSSAEAYPALRLMVLSATVADLCRSAGYIGSEHQSSPVDRRRFGPCLTVSGAVERGLLEARGMVRRSTLRPPSNTYAWKFAGALEEGAIGWLRFNKAEPALLARWQQLVEAPLAGTPFAGPLRGLRALQEEDFPTAQTVFAAELPLLEPFARDDPVARGDEAFWSLASKAGRRRWWPLLYPGWSGLALEEARRWRSLTRGTPGGADAAPGPARCLKLVAAVVEAVSLLQLTRPVEAAPLQGLLRSAVADGTGLDDTVVEQAVKALRQIDRATGQAPTSGSTSSTLK